MQRIFSLLCNISLADYIRKRRLSQAGYELYHNKGKIIDIALQYGYENATSFSRTFEKFHGIKLSQVKKGNWKKLWSGSLDKNHLNLSDFSLFMI